MQEGLIYLAVVLIAVAWLFKDGSIIEDIKTQINNLWRRK
jgi:hypothetical protein